MNEDQAVSALGALAHTQRLRVFRALVVAGPEGLTPSVLADQLDVARNSLSFHLKELAHAGLVTIEQQGRNLIYRADFAQMNSALYAASVVMVCFLNSRKNGGLLCSKPVR